jgi:DNA-binding beta-propeller fold protein YncE
MKTIISQVVLLIVLTTLHLHAQTSGFHLIKKTVIGGEGGWDYLKIDNEGRRVYVSHGNQVEVLDADTHKKLGIITDTQGVHGIAIAPKTGRGITTNGKTKTAKIFDTKTFAAIADLPTGAKPDAVMFDDFSGYVFVFNNEGASATVIDISSAKVIGTIELGGAPEAAVTNGKGIIFVNLEDTHEVVSFDSKTFAIKNRWSLAPGEEPTGLAFDPETHRLFSVCHNELMIILDSDNGKIIAQVPIGKRVDGAVFDPSSKCAISSNGEGTITIVKEFSANEFKVEETVRTEVGARTITYDPKTHHVFLSTAQYGAVPAATSENPNPRPSVVPGTFMILEYGRK